MPTVCINIGSNLGNRKANLQYAIAEIKNRLGCKLKVSAVYQTKPWGYQSDNPFYNIGVSIEANHDLQYLLEVFREIERDSGSLAHRKPDGSYADRMLDIDIICADGLIIDTPALTIPHRQMQFRAFVLYPLSELLPDWIHPVTKQSIEEMLAALPASERTSVQRLNDGF